MNRKRTHDNKNSITKKLERDLDYKISEILDQDKNINSYSSDYDLSSFNSIKQNKDRDKSTYDENDYEDDSYYNDSYENDSYYNNSYEDDNYYARGRDRVSKNKYYEDSNSHLPFTYDELSPKRNREQDLESEILSSIEPIVSEWLDLNMEKIVNKALRSHLSRNDNRSNFSAYSDKDHDISHQKDLYNRSDRQRSNKKTRGRVSSHARRSPRLTNRRGNDY